MTTFWLMIILFLIPVAMLYIDQAKDRKEYAALIAQERAGHVADAARQEAEQTKTAARYTYHAALKTLRLQPHDAASYQCALDAGRAYAALGHKQASGTIFDERALQADLHAALSLEDRLSQLATLRRQGLVSTIEYYERRHSILHEV